MFTVIVATHKRPLLLLRALRSIKAQDRDDVTTIVISDVFCTETQAVCEALLGDRDIFLQCAEGHGPGGSRNLGLRAIQSDWVCFLDDDDEFTPGFFKAAEPYLKPGLAGLYTDFVLSDDLMNGDEVLESAQSHMSLAAYPFQSLFVKNFIPNSGVIYAHEVLEKRVFDLSLPLNEDWDFLLNAIGGGAFAYAPVIGPIIHKRRFRNGENRGTRNLDLLPLTYLKIYTKWRAPSAELQAQRYALLSGAGVTVALQDL